MCPLSIGWAIWICVFIDWGYVRTSGVEAMKQYKVEVEKLENERQELANAERLFDLPITMYPELLQVQKDMKGMEQIYNLYEDQKVKKYTKKYLWPLC